MSSPSTPPAVPASAVPTPSAIVQQLLGALKTDVLLDGEGLLNTFFTNVEENPTPQNVAAQGAILFASALLQGPSLEKDSIVQIAKAGQALLAAALSGV